MKPSSCCCLFLLVFSALPHLFAAPLSAPQPSSAGYARCHEMNRLRHWTHFPLRVYLAPSPQNSPERLAQMYAGFDEWVSATGGLVRYHQVTDEAGADIRIRITSEVSLPKNARALGQTVLDYDGAVMRRADIQLVERDDDPAQFQEICAHEFGHALGIDGHSDDPDDMMFPVLAHSLFQIHNPQIDCFSGPGEVTPRDAATVLSAYPALAAPEKKH